MIRLILLRILAGSVSCVFSLMTCPGGETEAVDIGGRRELFVDRLLIEKLDGVSLQLQRPVSGGVALKFDKPWEGQVSGYVTVIHDGDVFRMYYRGRPLTGYGDNDPKAREVTCYAESRDGISWERPNLGLCLFHGSKDNNAILADVGHATHNFAPFLDTRPGVPSAERYKAVGGSRETGLVAFVSEDGIRFRQLREEPIIRGGAFDSQNNIFWSDHENCYVCFYRTFRNGVRWITRTTSPDFLSWSPASDMNFGDAPDEHLYTNQTVPYYRAPHIYVGTAARFWPDRRALTDDQVASLKLNAPENYDGLSDHSSDAVLLTSRGGDRYDRTFLESLVRPGPDLRNWTARTNYPARGIVPTGPGEMSIYIQRNYGQPAHWLERLTFRPDGFCSVHAGYQAGELITRPLIFSGSQLQLNVSTSAAGGVLVELQDSHGRAIPGFTLADCQEIHTDDLARTVKWTGGGDLHSLEGQAVRLRLRLQDADLFSFQFTR